ncbi:LysR family transcriptional regulator [Paraburkholderia sediminicola]
MDRSLEDHLRARLFNRSTRRVTLTEAGQRYLARCHERYSDEKRG